MCQSEPGAGLLGLLLTGEGSIQSGLKKEEFPSKGNQERHGSEERKEQQEQKVVGVGDCF